MAVNPKSAHFRLSRTCTGVTEASVACAAGATRRTKTSVHTAISGALRSCEFI
jgi:hypothetical protein